MQIARGDAAHLALAAAHRVRAVEQGLSSNVKLCVKTTFLTELSSSCQAFLTPALARCWTFLTPLLDPSALFDWYLRAQKPPNSAKLSISELKCA